MQSNKSWARTVKSKNYQISTMMRERSPSRQKRPSRDWVKLWNRSWCKQWINSVKSLKILQKLRMTLSFCLLSLELRQLKVEKQKKLSKKPRSMRRRPAKRWELFFKRLNILSSTKIRQSSFRLKPLQLVLRSSSILMKKKLALSPNSNNYCWCSKNLWRLKKSDLSFSINMTKCLTLYLHLISELKNWKVINCICLVSWRPMVIKVDLNTSSKLKSSTKLKASNLRVECKWNNMILRQHVTPWRLRKKKPKRGWMKTKKQVLKESPRNDYDRTQNKNKNNVWYKNRIIDKKLIVITKNIEKNKKKCPIMTIGQVIYKTR